MVVPWTGRFSTPFVCRLCARGYRAKTRRYATTTGSREVYDIVCVGGGPAGLGLLTSLLSKPETASLKLALVESQDLSYSSKWAPLENEYSNRVSSLTSSSKRYLESIGAWEKLDLARVQPYERMQVSDGVSGSRIKFDWQPYSRKEPVIAYMSENTNLVHSFLTRMLDLRECDIFDNTRVSDISLGPDKQSEIGSNLASWPHVTLSNGQQLAARLLVGADGANSPVRTFADIATRGWDYDRHGVVATLKLASPPGFPTTAYQRFLPTGPVALLPLPGSFASLVWSTTPQNAAHLKSLRAEDFVSMVNAAFRLMPVDINYMHTLASGQAEELSWRLQHTPQLVEGDEIPYSATEVQAGTIASFPLRMRHADTYATHRVALVGDAAHTMHPLAGQGLNMGIGDVESLSNAISYAMNHGMDIGDQLSLERYNSERYSANHILLGTVDKLHKLYSWESGPVVGLRSWGLDTVNRLTPLKEFLMKTAAGVRPGN